MSSHDSSRRDTGRHSTGHNTGTYSRAATVTRRTSTRTGVVTDGVFAGRRAWQRVTGVLRVAGDWLRYTVTPAGWLLIGVLVAGVVGGLVAGWV
ncbi:hypothetical protein BH11ACT3_BH11ACT3_12480 [soil metagenome]